MDLTPIERLSYRGKIYTGQLDGMSVIQPHPHMELVTKVPDNSLLHREQFVFIDSGQREGNTAYGIWVPHWMSMERIVRTLLTEAFNAKKEA